MSFRCVILAVLALTAATAGAQTLRYVSDELVVNLRTGQTSNHAIVRMLAAGTALEVLEQNEDSGYSHVRVPDRGTEGWVLTQYLTPEPIARDKLALVERELGSARGRVAELEGRVAALTEELAGMSGTLAQKESANTDLHDTLADVRRASASAIALRDENDDLRQEIERKEQEARQLRDENARLADRERQNWFLAGGSVMFGGIVLGLILPHMRRRRRTDW